MSGEQRENRTEEAREALLEAITVSARGIVKQGFAASSASALKDLAEAFAFAVTPGDPH
ncbi:hypothetical protein [Peterkaempfera griseoplana]|uniref:hypothetical protein n=1 Tax=Peterkaempfera griseoplana TaxID=66896 RepID=UPI000B28AD33|nr:hypothetical protein [Peterkaempfera griseoplana]